MWGIRVVIPPQMRGFVLKELHQSHPGIVRMKSLARLYVWWPGIDREIKQMDVQLAPLHPWEYPSRPWQRLHIDFAGPFFGKMWLIVVDASSKWPEVIYLKELSYEWYDHHGADEHLCAFWSSRSVSDGPQFISEQFKTFCKSNGIRHARVAPYHPSSNGEAEHFMKSFKNTFRAMDQDKE